MVKRYHYINASKDMYSFENKQVVIWGLGKSALRIYQEFALKGIDVIGFVDSFVADEGTFFVGKRVYTYEQLKTMKNVTVYISTLNIQFLKEILELTDKLEEMTIVARRSVYGCGEYDTDYMKKRIQKDIEIIEFVKDKLQDEKSKQTYENLLKYRVTNDSKLIEDVFENSHLQYFPKGEMIYPEENEVFIDAGAYNGDTSCQFANWCNGKYDKIYLLEPDNLMYEIVKERMRLENIKKFVCVKKGMYSMSTTLSFVNLADSASSHIVEQGNIQIETISIDEMVGSDKVTFIKMDIEGAELEALKGADETITRCKPKLAISIYHNEDDLWKIPFYIQKKYPWYKLYMRHYTDITTETVLYATV